MLYYNGCGHLAEAGLSCEPRFQKSAEKPAAQILSHLNFSATGRERTGIVVDCCDGRPFYRDQTSSSSLSSLGILDWTPFLDSSDPAELFYCNSSSSSPLPSSSSPLTSHWDLTLTGGIFAFGPIFMGFDTLDACEKGMTRRAVSS